jgi:hypothetical protein
VTGVTVAVEVAEAAGKPVTGEVFEASGTIEAAPNVKPENESFDTPPE